MELKELAENLGLLEEEEFKELAQLFMETSRSQLEQLQSALEQGNASGVVESAHSIKGAAGNLGLQDIYQAAKSVEEQARANRLEGITEKIHLMKQKLDAATWILEA